MARLHHHLKNAFIPHHGNDYRPHALRRHWLHTYTAVVVAVKVMAVVAVGFYASPARVSDVTPTAITTLSNQARQQNKVAIVKTNPLLTKAAQAKANDMAKRNYFAHVSPIGTTPWYWFKQAGYSYTYAGENLAMDFVTSEDVVAAWLKSPSHRSNLLNAKFKDIGAAVVTAKINGASSLIVVQMFGAPTPAPATKIVTAPAQTPTPAAAKQTAVKTLPTKVLGEAAPLIAPATPTIVTPAADTVVRTTTPNVIGQAEPGSTVTLFVNGQRVASAVTDSTGVFSVAPDQALIDGTSTIQATATARQLTSGLSPPHTVTIDTAPPVINTANSIILPSYLARGGYDVITTVTGSPAVVTASYGNQMTTLLPDQGNFVGHLRGGDRQIGSIISIAAADTAGNSVRTAVIDPSIFTTGVVASAGGPFVTALKVVFYSRTFLMFVLVLLFIVATLNIAVEWRHQHHPTIIHSLLVLFLIGTFLVM